MATLDHLRQRLIGRWQTGYARAGTELERELVRTSPVDSGQMRDETRVFPRGPGQLEVVVGTDYASFVRDGTPPHEIVPTNAQALRFVASDGTTVFARRVQHPGTQPNPWYENALDLFPALVQQEIGKLP